MTAFNPLTLTLEGFGSFRNKQSFRFPQEPGLYFMRGENRLEPRLGANAAGKSTIWKALCWVLWGKTANGLKAGNVSSWGLKKGTGVTLDFEGELNGGWLQYSLARTWKPNTWTLTNGMGDVVDLAKDDTNLVLDMLKLQFEPFLHSVYMAQRGEMFLDLPPEPKAALFSSVMDLTRWLTYSAEASARAADQDKVSRRLESDLAELKGRVEATDNRDLEIEAENFEQRTRDQLDEAHQEYNQVLRRSKAAKKDQDEADDAEAEAFEECKKTKAHMEDAGDWAATKLKMLRASEDRLISLTKEVEHAKAHIGSLVVAKECPTCGAMPRPEELRRLIAEAKRAEDRAAEAVAKTKSCVEVLREEYNSAARNLDDAEIRHREAIDRSKDASERLRNARMRHQTDEKRLDQLEDEVERLETVKNPFHALLQERKQGRDRAQEEFQQVRAQLDRSYEQHALFSFWVRGFKDVRLQLISEALGELEVEVNSELMELGLIGWELRFDVDAETKAGKLSRGFSVSVLSPHNDERVPWESWSGGESQRLRLAAQCGLANLIRSRTGCDIPLEVWDEPTEGLSEEGITDLMQALSERAARERRAIWIVDHRALGYGGFSGTVTVVRDEKGSRVVQSTV